MIRKLLLGGILIGAAATPAFAQDAASLNATGIRYAQEQDYVAALKWYELAAANGSVAALGNIATLYFYGWGVPQSYEQAAKVLELAVNAGDPDAENKLATLYDGGLGVSQDHARAFALYRQAAEQGYTPAMANLGRMYIEAQGTDRNDEHGFALLRAAIDSGLPASMQSMANQELQVATARLDDSQRAQASEDSKKLVAAVAPNSSVTR